MQTLKILSALFAAAALAGCSVISRQVRSEATPGIPFPVLLEEARAYKGETVILGGHIISTRNLGNQTLITILQAPLRVMDEPVSRDRSQGRIIVVHDGFLDPEVYRKDRKITVAGILVGSWTDPTGEYPKPYLKMNSREIYLWRDLAPPYAYNDYWDEDVTPLFYRRHHYHHHHRHYPFW